MLYLLCAFLLLHAKLRRRKDFKKSEGTGVEGPPHFPSPSQLFFSHCRLTCCEHGKDKPNFDGGLEGKGRGRTLASPSVSSLSG